MIGIYILINNINQKKYIGQSWDIYKRIRSHKNGDDDSLISRAIIKYGFDNFSIQTIQVPDDQILLDNIESYLICKHSIKPIGYNLKTGGSRGKHSEESKKKMSIALKGKLKSKEHIENMPTKFKQGHVPANKGISLSQCTKEKISKSLTGKKLSSKHVSNLLGNQNHLGHKHSEEAKQKIKIARANQSFSEESRLKKSETLKRLWAEKWIDRKKKI